MCELLSIHDIASNEFRSVLEHSIRNGLTSCIRLATSELLLPMRGSMTVLGHRNSLLGERVHIRLAIRRLMDIITALYK